MKYLVLAVIISTSSFAQLNLFGKGKKVDAKKDVEKISKLALGQETHGGDLVFCYDDPKASELKGFHNFDYLQTYKQSNKNKDVVVKNAWLGADSYSIRLLKILNKKYPEMGREFEQYLRLRDNEDDPTQPQMWEESSFGLELTSEIDLKDDQWLKSYQKRYQRLPLNCYSDYDENVTYTPNNLPSKIKLYRTITKITSSSKKLITFSYDPYLISQINEPVSESFLMVHEFLRLFSTNEIAIRKANRLLHLSFIEKPKYDLKTALNNIEIKVKSPEIRTTISKHHIRGGYIPSYNNDPVKREEALGRVYRKCLKQRQNLIDIYGKDLTFIEDCAKENIKMYLKAVRHSADKIQKSFSYGTFSSPSTFFPARYLHFIDTWPETRKPDSDEYIQLLGYEAFISLEYHLAKGLSVKILHKQSAKVFVTNVDYFNLASIAKARVDHEAKKNKFCDKREAALRNAYKERFAGMLCVVSGSDTDSNWISTDQKFTSTELKTTVNVTFYLHY